MLVVGRSVRGLRSALVACVALVLLLGAPAWAQKGLKLPAGTQVLIQAKQDVDSGGLKAGSAVDFAVSKPVVVAGLTVIAAGAPARGACLFQKGGGVGHGGEMILMVDDVQAVDGTWIALRTGPAVDGAMDKIIPKESLDYAKAKFPNGRNRLLRASQVITTWTERDRQLARSGSGRTAKVKVLPLALPRAAGERGVKVPDGTALRVHALSEISSRDVQTGDRVDFVVVEDVKVGNAVVVREGATAKGTVIFAKKAGKANKSGMLVMTLDKVQAVDGSWIRVTASAAKKGGSNQIYATAMGMIIPFSGLVIDGREAVVATNREIDAVSRGSRIVEVKK